MPDNNTMIDVITAQVMTAIQAPLIEIAACYENNQNDDGDWSWDSSNIAEAIYLILERLGVIKRCADCQYDFAWAITAEPELWNCPNSGSHMCSEGCGNINDECCCDNCSHCGYYDCECPRCENCEESIHECSCIDAEKMWPVDV